MQSEAAHRQEVRASICLAELTSFQSPGKLVTVYTLRRFLITSSGPRTFLVAASSRKALKKTKQGASMASVGRCDLLQQDKLGFTEQIFPKRF